jgi:putative transcriptional regulator
MTIKMKLRNLRENHPDKPSQRVLGDVLGIAEANYRRLENGYAKSISFDALNRLCNFFNCTPNDLLEFENDGSDA